MKVSPRGLPQRRNAHSYIFTPVSPCRAHIGPNSPKRGQIETFAQNLPGFVDNIRLNSRGTYWVGLSLVRHAQLPSVLDKYGNQPKMRGAIMGVSGPVFVWVREAIMGMDVLVVI